MQFVVTHVPMYNVGIICLTIPINSPAALHVNFNAINYIIKYIFISLQYLVVQHSLVTMITSITNSGIRITLLLLVLCLGLAMMFVVIAFLVFTD